MPRALDTHLVDSCLSRLTLFCVRLQPLLLCRLFAIPEQFLLRTLRIVAVGGPAASLEFQHCRLPLRIRVPNSLGTSYGCRMPTKTAHSFAFVLRSHPDPHPSIGSLCQAVRSRWMPPWFRLKPPDR